MGLHQFVLSHLPFNRCHIRPVCTLTSHCLSRPKCRYKFELFTDHAYPTSHISTQPNNEKAAQSFPVCVPPKMTENALFFYKIYSEVPQMDAFVIFNRLVAELRDNSSADGSASFTQRKP